MNITRVLLILAMLIGYLGMSAQTVRGLGLHFGTVSANGFSYRQFNGKHGMQATIGAITYGSDDTYFPYDYYNPNQGNTITLTEDGRKTNVNIGINYLYSLADNKTGRFYLFAGASYLYSRVRVIEQDYVWQGSYYTMTSQRKVIDNRGQYYLGGGLGFEFTLGRGFKWAIEMPLTVNEKGDITMYIPQSGLYYYFD